MSYVGKYKHVYACGRDGMFAKIDPYGNLQWIKNIGGQTNLNFAEATNGEFMICGVAQVAGAGQLSLVRTDSAGNIIYSKIYKSSRLLDAKIVRADSTKDEYLIKFWFRTISSGDDIAVMKIKGNGKPIWQYRYGEGFYDEQTGGIVPDGNGGAYVSGLSNQGTGKLFWGHIDENGVMDEIKYYGNNFGPSDNLFRTSDGGFIISGIYASGGIYTRDPFAIKLDADGNPEWFYSYKNEAYSLAFGYSGNCSIAEGADGDIYVSGLSGSGPEFHLRVMKINADGVLEWIKDGEPSASTSYYQTSVLYIPRENHEIIWIADSKNYGADGFGLNDLVISAEESELNSCLWSEVFPETATQSFNPVSGNTVRFDITPSKTTLPLPFNLVYDTAPVCDGEFAFVAEENTRLMETNYGINYISDSLAYIKSLQENFNAESKLLIYPNPASEYINILMQDDYASFVIRNISGEQIKSATINHLNQVQIDMHDLSPGIYSIEFMSENHEIISERFVKN